MNRTLYMLAVVFGSFSLFATVAVGILFGVKAALMVVAAAFVAVFIALIAEYLIWKKFFDL